MRLLMFWEDRVSSKCLLLYRQPLCSIHKYIFCILPPQLNLFPSLHLHSFNLFRPSASSTHLIATASKSVGLPLARHKCRHRIICIMSFPRHSLCPKIEAQTPEHGLRFPDWSIQTASLLPYELRHTRLPCHSPSLELGQTHVHWISDAIQPTILCRPLLLPASGSSPVSQVFPSGGQSTGAPASASVLPMNIQDWSPLGWTGWTSLQAKGLSRVFFTPYLCALPP